MTPKRLIEVLTIKMKNGRPVLIKGAPGVGKSDIVARVAKTLKMDLLLMHPVVSDPTDYKGMPGIIQDGKKGPRAEFLPFGDLKKLISAKKPTIAFLDDLGQAPATVQAACMQLILARRVNGHSVSDKVVFVAATNRREDMAGVTGILEPVKSRFNTILELVADPDEWIEWAYENDMPAALIGFVHFRPTLLNSGAATRDIVNHPCPRNFFHAGQSINDGLIDLEDLSGTLGEGCAAELMGFMRIYESLPNIAAIITDPDSAIVPTDPAALYAIVSALVSKITENNASRILKYANRLPQDFSVLLIRDSIRREPKIQNTKAFIKWATEHKDVLM